METNEKKEETTQAQPKKQQFECAKKQKIQKAERIRKCRIDANAVRGVWVEDW